METAVWGSMLEQFTATGITNQMEYLLRILIASLLGIMIGSERKNRNKSAGIRTHMIIAMGSALMMVVSKYGFYDNSRWDASRVASQVVSGVGFLGAGVIFVRNNLVSGLTTSAGMWATAGVGLAMGAGMYVVGICSAVMVVVIQFITHKIIFGGICSGIAWFDRHVVDGSLNGLAAVTQRLSLAIRGLQSGQLQWYAYVFLIGTLVLTLLIVFC